MCQVLSSVLQCEVLAEVIPSCRTPDEQAAVLGTIAHHVAEHSDVYLDVTHGYRHLPLLQLLSAFHLAEVKQSRIQGIFYGAADMACEHPEHKAPVIELSFVRDMIDWIKSAAVLMRTGLYGELADRFPKGIGAKLSQAHHLEQVNRVDQATRLARDAYDMIRGLPLPLAARLFKDNLLQELQWSLAENYALRQLQCADQAIARGQYLHAAIMMLEASITARVPRNKDPLNYEVREETRQKIANEGHEHFEKLNVLRNVLAHGSRPHGSHAPWIEEACRDQASMAALLRSFSAALHHDLASCDRS